MDSSEFIDGFSEFRFLSNFWPATITHDGHSWASSEHMYQAYKTIIPEQREWFKNVHAGKAKRLGRKVTVRNDWEVVKYETMEMIVRLKFQQNPHLAEMLIATSDLYIQETNTWNDTYWGVCNDIGENNLGFILMQIRRELVDSL